MSCQESPTRTCRGMECWLRPDVPGICNKATGKWVPSDEEQEAEGPALWMWLQADRGQYGLRPASATRWISTTATYAQGAADGDAHATDGNAYAAVLEGHQRARRR